MVRLVKCGLSLFPRTLPERLNRVEPGSFLTLHYRLRGDDGAAFVDTFATQPATLSLGTGELAPAMEARLIGMEAGSEGSFALAAGEVFGAARSRRSCSASAAPCSRGKAMPTTTTASATSSAFPVPTAAPIAGIVRSIDDDSLLFDFNHPLAGRPLTFDVKLIGVHRRHDASTKSSSPSRAASAPASTVRSRSSSARCRSSARRSTCATRSSTTPTSSRT